MPPGTDELDVERLAAVAVADDPRRAARARGVAVAPLHEREEHGLQLQALLGQAVLVTHALAGLAVLAPGEHPVVDQPAQTVAEDGPGDAEVALDLVEPAHPVEHLAEDEDRPSLADHLEGPGDRAVLGALLPPVHGPSIAPGLCN